MKREIKITVKKDHNHYALIEQVNNKENEINRGIFLDKDQYEQLRQHFVSGSLPSIDPLDDENSEIHKIGREIAEMSDEEFDNNCKAITDMLSRSKGNDR
jgi:hypothetical protein